MEHLPSILSSLRVLRGKLAKKSIIALLLFRSHLETQYTQHLRATLPIKLLLSSDVAQLVYGPSDCLAFREHLPFLQLNPTTNVSRWRQTWVLTTSSILARLTPYKRFSR